MPYIEQVSLGDQWDYSKPWHQHPEAVRTVVPDIFLCQSRRSGTRPIGTRNLRTTVTGGGGRPPCGCPIPPLPVDVTLDVEGALSDYAGNHGDLTPGATGEPTDFYYGGNGTGVIISVRPNCKAGKAIAPSDRIRMASVSNPVFSPCAKAAPSAIASGMKSDSIATNWAIELFDWASSVSNPQTQSRQQRRP